MSTVNIVKYYFHARNVPVSEERTRLPNSQGKGALPKSNPCAVCLFLPRMV
ncbi:hypothetical protein FOC4_g10005324 [Fusarium odoratissimum]|uniref:Uncharacterized protein n=1 Tax=Fusarium oxysporum f. sp. cubense (strain race 4) TaxID=2502994 RepID=N1RSV6_FUSC4|nr:hypothetical protein FOC4_g10005324 [Fusarium odoratissimum]